MFITGDAGMGKTTLLQHIVERSRATWTVARVECSSPVAGVDVGSIEALHPWIALIRELSSGTQRADTKQLAADLALTWVKFVPIVGDLIESTVNTVGIVKRHRSRAAEPAVSREHVLEQCLGFFRAAAQHLRLMLIIDDAHWADDSSLNMLFALARENHERIKIIVAFRDMDARTSVNGEEHSILRIRRELERYDLCASIGLPPLTASEVREMLGDSLSDHDIRSALSFSGGNPLLVHGWSAEGGASSTVTAVVQERIRRLDSGLLDLLRYAAAEGEQFCSSTLHVLTGSLPLQIATNLRHAEVQHGLIASIGKQRFYSTETSVYTFTSDAVRSALERELSSEESELLHAAIADHVRSELSRARELGQSEAHIRVRLAAHEIAASKYAEAARTLIEHARGLWDIFASSEMIEVLDRVDSIIDRIENASQRDLLIADTCELRAQRACFESDLKDAHALCERAYKLFEARGERQRACDVLYRLGVVANHRGDPSLVCALADRISMIAEESDYEKGRMSAITMRGFWLDSEGRFDEAIACFADLEARTRGQRTRERAAALVNLMRLRSIQGVEHDVIPSLEEAVSIFKELSRWDSAARALNILGIAFRNLGRVDEARSFYEESLELHERIGDRVGVASLCTNLGQLHLDAGNVEDALILFEKSIEIKRARNDGYGLAIALYSRAVARRLCGDHEGCARDLRESREIAVSIGEASVIAEVERLMSSPDER